MLLLRESSEPMIPQAQDVCIPPQWLHSFNKVFTQAAYHKGSAEKTLAINVTATVTLTDVILSALSTEGYKLAQDATSVLEDWLSEGSVILRQGQTYTFTPEVASDGKGGSDISKAYHFRLDMTEPALQGVVRKGSTRFYVALAPGPLVEEVNLDMDGDDTGSELEAIEIDESFLASSVIHNKYSSSSGEHETSSNDAKYKGDHPNESKVLRVEALRLPTSDIHEDCIMYLRTSDLGKVGALNGDWVSL